MATNINEALLVHPERDFEDHLLIPANNRILFSGRFGIGKSTFINHFFSKHSVYNCIHLFPVNYSVATNEDIFKYIKYDIILEMISNQYPIEYLDFSQWQSLPGFLAENFKRLGATLLYAIPGVGKDLVDLADRVIDFTEKFDQRHEENNKQGNDAKTITSYLSMVENLDGGLYESGIETRTIEKILVKKKELEAGKENILIIDDLDRIDPDHIFRILNIFSAHFDYHNNTKNKFGFDKVILVCDVENIRSIFHKKYGLDTDFNGYIDKFYSHSIFNFLNKKALTAFVKESLYNIEWRSMDLASSEILYYKDKLLGDRSFLILFIVELCQMGLLNLRNIVKWHESPFHFQQFEDFEGKQLNIETNLSILIMKFLGVFFGSFSSLAAVIERISPSKFLFNKSVMEHFCVQLLRLFTRQSGDGFNVEMNFGHGDMMYSAKYEESQEIYTLKVDRLIPFNQGSKTRQAIAVDAVILKICMLKYIEHL